jgi:hypothetical protein
VRDFETILVVAGLAFLFIALIGGGKLRFRTMAFLMGVALVSIGIAVYTGWIPVNPASLPRESKPSPSALPTISPSPPVNRNATP